jgi:hypothetical protein
MNVYVKLAGCKRHLFDCEDLFAKHTLLSALQKPMSNITLTAARVYLLGDQAISLLDRGPL